MVQVAEKIKNTTLDKLERRTLDRMVQKNEVSEVDFFMSLFDDAYGAETESLEGAEQDLTEQQNEDSQQILYYEEINRELVAEVKEKTGIEEIDNSIIEATKWAVIDKLKDMQQEKLLGFFEAYNVTTEEYVKVQMWSYFPIVGTVIYFIMLVLLSINRHGKYKVSLQNWARANLKLFWIYLVVTIIVLFVMYWSGISFIHIIQRGLR